MSESKEQRRPNDEACVGCEYAGGIVLHCCTKPTSEFYGGLVDWEGWCPEFLPRKVKAGVA